MKSYADLGGCFPPQPSASADNTLLDLHNSSYHTQPRQIIAKYCQARRDDSVEGGSFIFGRYFSPQGARDPRRVWGHASPRKFCKFRFSHVLFPAFRHHF